MGYWAQKKADVTCNSLREGINNQPTVYWGRFQIDFVDPDFPSRWKAKWGYCDDEPTHNWNAVPLVGNAQPAKVDSQEIRFAKGKSSTYFERSIIRGEQGYYHFYAKKGQMLELDLAAEEDNAVFAVYQPKYKIGRDADGYIEVLGDALNGATVYDQAKSWGGILPVSGKYLIVVGATRGNASYKLNISIK